MNVSNPQVMGILNVTPDSFFAGSRKQTEGEIAARVNQIVGEGGSIIDVGAFSTRPGAMHVPLEEELRRMRFGLEIVRREQPDACLSVDTYRPEVARMAVEEFGADIINDVSEGGLTAMVDTPMADADPTLSGGDGVPPIFREVARLGVDYVLMSVQPTVDSMISNFRKEISLLRTLGHEKIILDPGYGFGKGVIDGNYAILAAQKRLKEEFPDLPLLVGVSRKRMIWQLSGTSADEALNGTTAVNMLALERGADILRVHDVREAVETIAIWQKMVDCTL